MRLTRRGRAATGFAGVLLALGALAGRPLVVAGGGLLGGWLLARLVVLSVRARRLSEDLAVEVDVSPDRVTVGTATECRLAVSLGWPAHSPVSVTVATPLAATGPEQLTASLAVGDRAAETVEPIAVPAAGRYTVGAPTVTVTAPDEVATTTVGTTASATITVEPAGTGPIHVGAGGDPVTAATGTHPAGRSASGVEPTAVRRYVPGDALRHVDWKATARLGEPHVREYDARARRPTVLVVDHRARLGSDVADLTPLAAARDVALSIATATRRAGDPLGLLTVGDAGITDRVRVDVGPDHYGRILRRLHALAPTTALRSDPPTVGPTRAKRVRSRLDGSTAFDRAVAPYLADRTRYLERVADAPLVAAARRAVEGGPEVRLVVLVTDDRDRAATREAVGVVRAAGDAVLALLVPRVLFDPVTVSAPEGGVDRFRSFDAFRADLAADDRVTALEVGPADRLAAVLPDRGTVGEGRA